MRKEQIRSQGQRSRSNTNDNRLNSLRAFWRLENNFTAEFWNSRSRVHSFVRTHFQHFGGFKMSFFRIVKPMLQGYVTSCEHIFSFIGTWKCDSFNSRSKFKGHAKSSNSRPGSKAKGECQTRTTHRLSSLRAFSRPENTFTAESSNSVQGYVSSCEHIFCILAAWKCDFCRVVKPIFQGYVASCEHIFSFMATWKCDSFNSRSKSYDFFPPLPQHTFLQKVLLRL